MTLTRAVQRRAISLKSQESKLERVVSKALGGLCLWLLQGRLKKILLLSIFAFFASCCPASNFMQPDWPVRNLELQNPSINAPKLHTICLLLARIENCEWAHREASRHGKLRPSILDVSSFSYSFFTPEKLTRPRKLAGYPKLFGRHEKLSRFFLLFEEVWFLTGHFHRFRASKSVDQQMLWSSETWSGRKFRPGSAAMM